VLSYTYLCIPVNINTAERSEEAAKAYAAKREYQERIDQIARDFDEEKKLTYEITQDMTRQYKGMQEELLGRVGSTPVVLCTSWHGVATDPRIVHTRSD
jgi:hypothetical protein